MKDDKAILVIGAGDATGGAIARRFAREGYIACVTRRSADKLQPLVEQIRAEGGRAQAFGSDARKEEEMVALVERIEREVAPIEVAVFNIGANVRFGITETTSRVYFKVWEMACFAGFLTGYLVYDVLHYATHHLPMRAPVLKWLKRNHLLHHHATPDERFGVSSPLWDFVLRTAPQSDGREVDERVGLG